jgi:hypothetical protein
MAQVSKHEERAEVLAKQCMCMCVSVWIAQVSKYEERAEVLAEQRKRDSMGPIKKVGKSYYIVTV